MPVVRGPRAFFCNPIKSRVDKKRSNERLSDARCGSAVTRKRLQMRPRLLMQGLIYASIDQVLQNLGGFGTHSEPVAFTPDDTREMLPLWPQCWDVGEEGDGQN
jgi:hypothetical protein